LMIQSICAINSPLKCAFKGEAIPTPKGWIKYDDDSGVQTHQCHEYRKSALLRGEYEMNVRPTLRERVYLRFQPEMLIDTRKVHAWSRTWMRQISLLSSNRLKNSRNRNGG
jgi:hypothetical protein